MTKQKMANRQVNLKQRIKVFEGHLIKNKSIFYLCKSKEVLNKRKLDQQDDESNRSSSIKQNRFKDDSGSKSSSSHSNDNKKVKKSDDTSEKDSVIKTSKIQLKLASTASILSVCVHVKISGQTLFFFF